MQQQEKLKPGFRQTIEYPLSEEVLLVTFLDDSGKARYILVDKTKLNGRQICSKFTINRRPFEITEFQNCLFEIDIETGKLYCYNKTMNICRLLHPRSINKTTLTYVDENGGIHCLDLTQGCDCITDSNLKNFFNRLPLINGAEKYRILSALIALDSCGMKPKLDLNRAHFIYSYKDFLEHMIGLNHGLWTRLLKICWQFGSYDRKASEKINDVIEKEIEKLNINQFYYSNNCLAWNHFFFRTKI